MSREGVSRPPRTSLADSFTAPPAAAPDRTAGLTGVLPPRPAVPPAAAAPVSAEPAAGEGQGQVSLPEGRDGAPRRTARPRSSRPVQAVPDLPADAADDPDRVRNVQMYLPVEVAERLREMSRARDLTYGELLVEAGRAHHEDLPGDLRAAEPPAGPPGTMPGRVVRHAKARVPAQVRLSGRQLAFLDEQARTLGAESRNAVIVALLARHVGLAPTQ